MPIYDYTCSECEHEFERVNTIADRKTCECPKCGSMATQRLRTINFKCDGTDPGFPTAYDNWAKTHVKEAKRQAKYDD